MAKISPAKVEKALSVAAVIAASLAQNGTLASDKSVRQCCLTGLRLTLAMDSVVACAESNPALLETPLDDGNIWVLLSEEVKKMAEQAAQKAAEEAEKAAAAEAAKNSDKTDAGKK